MTAVIPTLWAITGLLTLILIVLVLQRRHLDTTSALVAWRLNNIHDRLITIAEAAQDTNGALAGINASIDAREDQS